jgi:hypothetical protein
MSWPSLPQDAFGGVVEPPARPHPRLLAACKQQWLLTARSTTASPFHLAVARALEHLGLRPRLEVLTGDGMFTVDIVVSWRGR